MGEAITKCPHCGTDIPTGDQFFLNNDLMIDAHVPCKSCGKTIEKGGSFVEQPGDFD